MFCCDKNLANARSSCSFNPQFVAPFAHFSLWITKEKHWFNVPPCNELKRENAACHALAFSHEPCTVTKGSTQNAWSGQIRCSALWEANKCSISNRRHILELYDMSTHVQYFPISKATAVMSKNNIPNNSVCYSFWSSKTQQTVRTNPNNMLNWFVSFSASAMDIPTGPIQLYISLVEWPSVHHSEENGQWYQNNLPLA